MNQTQDGYDRSEMVDYHYDKFPPPNRLDYQRLLLPVSEAQSKLARYDQMLGRMRGNEWLLLSPMRKQEAVLSSKMEGTISTLDDVLQYDESDPNDPNSDTHEVIAHDWALMKAQQIIENGYPINDALVRGMHKELMQRNIRGADKSPGEYKTEQNHVGDKIRKKYSFQPIAPIHLSSAMEKLFAFIEDQDQEILIRTALAHIEFEALHPFDDGNGRIGRMLIPLILCKYGALSQPHFYISAFFEKHKDEGLPILTWKEIVT